MFDGPEQTGSARRGCVTPPGAKYMSGAGAGLSPGDGLMWFDSTAAHLVSVKIAEKEVLPVK